MNTIKIFPLNDAELGYLFFQKRDKKGISLRNAAKELNSSYASLNRFENGKQFLSMKKIIEYANYLELDLKFCVTD